MPTATAARNKGFTLVELIIALLILSVVVGIGIPSFQSFIRNHQLTSRANSLIVAMQVARSEAVARGRPVSACPSTVSTEPATCDSTDWAGGWLVAIDNNFSEDVDINEVLRVNSNDTDVVTDTDTSPPYVRFRPSGLRDSSDAAVDAEELHIRIKRDDCAAGEGGARDIIISKGGRAHVDTDVAC